MASINGLFNRLLEGHLSGCGSSGGPARLQLDPPDVPRARRRKALRSALYGSLFAELSGPLSRRRDEAVASERRCGLKEQLLQVVFDMRRRRRYDQAHRLEALVASLPDLADGCHAELMAAIQLLLVLAGTGLKQAGNTAVGHREPDLPLVGPGNKDDRAVMLSAGPRYHGDSCHVYHQGYQGYIHYSRDLFEGPSPRSGHPLGPPSGWEKDRTLHRKLFEVEPGRDLHGNGLFSLRGLLNSPHEQTTRETLFSGLVHSKTRQLDVKLAFPDLPDTSNADLLGLQIPTPSEPSEDEGFHETSSSLSTPVSERSAAAAGEGNIWEMALKHRPSRHYTWETIGRMPRATERPYLTEAGPKVFDEVYRLRCQEASVLDASLERPVEVLADQVQLARDSVHVLLSVPSYTFHLNKDGHCFQVNPDQCLTGTTPGSLGRLLAELAQAGTDHLRLSAFARQRLALDSAYSGGLVLEAFKAGVRRFLQHYQALVQRLSTSAAAGAAAASVTVTGADLTVMTLQSMVGRMIQQIRYLADLCQCGSPKAGQHGEPGDSCPQGIKLLSYLYQEALDCSLQDRYQLVLSLLRSSCGPYLMFIQDWVFHGICRDVYGEFLIAVNDDYLHYRDKHYWTQGYVLKSDNAEQSVPVFLKDLAYDIYVCGKSLNLMKLCCPEHFLCNPGITSPRISLTFSTEELDNSAKRTRVYVAHMQTLARQKTISRQEKELMELEARQELVTQARKTAADEIKRFQDAILEQRVAEDAKKRQEFQELKAQMQRDLVRRSVAEESERKEDAERMEALTKREQGEAKAEYELEQRVREEVIEYYASLSEEAAARERKALWRVRRHQLDQARLEFLSRDEARMRLELAKRQPVGAADAGELEERPEAVENRAVDTEEAPPAGGRRSAAPPEGGVSVAGFAVDRTDGSANVQLLAPSERIGPQQGSAHVDVKPLPDDPAALPPPPPRPGGGGGGPQPADQPLPGAAAPDLHVRAGSGALPTGQLPNEDIEAALQMIGGGSTGRGPAKSHGGRPASPPNLMDVSIGDFLPKEQTRPDDDNNDDQEMAPPNDVDVDDVLIQIGSSLPTEAPARKAAGHQAKRSGVLEDLLGLPTAADSSKTQPVSTASAAPAHPSDSVAGDILYPSVQARPLPVGEGTDVRPAASQSQGGHGTTEGGAEHPHPAGHAAKAAQPHPSDSTISLVPAAPVEPPVASSPALRSGPPDSTLEGGPPDESRGGWVTKTRNPYGHAGDSSAGDLLYPTAQQRALEQLSGPADSRPEGFESDAGSGPTSQPPGPLLAKPYLGHASDSTVQSMLYPDDKQSSSVAGPGRRETRQKSAAAAPHGHHPSDSTAQNFMYRSGAPAGRKTDGPSLTHAPDDTDAAKEPAVVPWMGQAVESYQDNFDALNLPPMPDLLANMGYVPLSSEIGDYGLQAAESEGVEAVELQSLPIIMRRSVTAPLLAQIGLVNRSILDYFMVELGIGRHFAAIRSFLFLEDGEFGHSLCDQLFEKVAQGLRPTELLTPIVLNQLLARAIQNSASRESEYANNLGFSLKYLPHVFRPNAIDTFDCLELRYRMDWPCNIVITDTCLAKYNRVFSFLLQLKRISWVLRDIYFQLKRGAMVSHAGNSPQFRQLQLFRHEMQHFVNVMQGYVVNQVIHVTWEEFQRQLKSEVHNLDDLHQKHSEYLNKAIFRCLLNKKAAPVMKIISDILCLILKVRTQLVALPWAQDPATGQAVHPAFHTIRTSYLAFKDYSEFLYKVVAKLVTRGYQPHLEEFMLRLNFNDFYQES